MNESNRQKKVSQIIHEDFAELFRKQSAESKQNLLISVSDVRVTADLSIARIYLSIFPTELRKPVMKEIEENKAQYRNFIGNKMAKQKKRLRAQITVGHDADGSALELKRDQVAHAVAPFSMASPAIEAIACPTRSPSRFA